MGIFVYYCFLKKRNLCLQHVFSFSEKKYITLEISILFRIDVLSGSLSLFLFLSRARIHTHTYARTHAHTLTSVVCKMYNLACQ